MTERLYYDQSYLTEFDAKVLSCEARDGAFDVVLDRTAFYPTSGGQPFDYGFIDRKRVIDVNADAAGIVHHLCAEPVEAGTHAKCSIDWGTRFLYMQQHTADHLIAGYIHRNWGGYTVGLHIGYDFSTIDVIMPEGQMRLNEDRMAALECWANMDIQRDLPVRAFFPTPEEMAALPLRKDPTVTEHIRVVLIGEEECVACGGTHVSSLGQIGVVKILWTAPARGKMRLAFVAGMRAVQDYMRRFAATEAAGALLSCQATELPNAVRALQEKSRALELELSQLKRGAALARADGLLAAAVARADGWRMVCANMPDLDMDALKELAKRLIEEDKLIALLSCGPQVLFARSAGAGLDMGRLMKDAMDRFSGRGGGRPEFAQGAAADGEAAVEWARKMTG